MAVTNFDIQALLHDMRAEQREDIRALASKVEAGFRAQSEWSTEHEKSDTQNFHAIQDRMATVERATNAAKWAIRTTVGAAIVYMVSLLRYVPAILR